MIKLTRLGVALFACLAAAPLAAQDSPALNAARPLRIYLDCTGVSCNLDYFRGEIGYVDYVRDRADAEVHVLVATERTGNGGARYSVSFLGQGGFRGRSQLLRAESDPNASENAVRQRLAATVKLGLVPYLAERPAGANLRITYVAPAAGGAAAAAADPWDHWSFTASANGFFNGEDSYSSRYLYGSFSANRVTAASKILLSVGGSEDRSRFDLDSVTSVVSHSRSRHANGTVVLSLSPHLSAGVLASASSSTYNNQDLAARLAPAVEWDLYPYQESAKRLLTVQYALGPRHYVYAERTIFGKTSETLLQHSLVATATMVQRWGSTNVSAAGYSYLSQPAKNRVELEGQVQLNLVKGLRFNLSGSVQRIRDQLFLSASGATQEEILLRQRALATGFQYFGSFGLSYNFGSRLNNIVNPRFPS
jgi:hypothetical protein